MVSTAVHERAGAPSLRRALAIAFVGTLSLVAVTTLTTQAMFTTQAGSSGNTFVGGTVDLTLGQTSAAVTMAPMMPGDKVTAPLSVDNSGSVGLRYSMTSTTSTTGDASLPNLLVLTIKDDVPAASCTDAQWATGTNVVYTGPLGDDAAPTHVLGSPAQGPDAGDRPLGAGASETLCVQVEYPLGADAGEGATTTATFRFDAEQTKNNG
jgi:hypothetical protein